MKKTNKILSIFLAMLMVLSIVPFTGISAFAVEGLYIDGDLLWGCLAAGDVVLPDEVTRVGDMTTGQEDRGLTSIIMPNVTSIGTEAFSWSASLKYAAMPKATFIDSAAFAQCTSLTTILINSDVSIPDSVLFGFSANLKTVYYIEGSKNLDALKTELGRQNGVDVNNLTFVKHEHSYTNGVCKDCGLKEPSPFIIDANGVLTGYTGNGGDIVIPEGVTAIGENAFCANKNITSVKFPESLTSIGQWAFHLCTNLVSVTIPGNVKTIGNAAFSDCDKLADVTIEDGVESIGEDAFCYCSALTSIELPDSVTSIGSMAFANCFALKSVTISDKVTSIGSDAFRDSKLKVYVTCDSDVDTVKKAIVATGNTTSTFEQIAHVFVGGVCSVCSYQDTELSRCLATADTSAKGRSTDRAGRRDRRHRDYLIENKKACTLLCKQGTRFIPISLILTSKRRICFFGS